MSDLGQPRRLFTVRPIAETDREAIGVAIAADPDHAGKVEPDFFIKAARGAESFAIGHKDGNVIMYVRCENVMRLHIQFVDGERAAAALVMGLEWLKSKARERGFRELVYDSVTKKLIHFFERLGFHAHRREYSAQI